MIYSVANQICAFIFFLLVAICLRWVLLWAGYRSLGLGQNVPWHSWARAAVPQHPDHCPPGGYPATSWNSSQMSSIQARVPETQFLACYEACPFQFTWIPASAFEWLPAVNWTWLNYSLRNNYSAQNFSLAFQGLRAKSHLSIRTLTHVKDKEGRNIFMRPGFVIYVLSPKLVSWQSIELSEGNIWSQTHAYP